MRRFAFLAACLMAAGVLAGCGGDPEPGDTIKRQTYESAEVQFTAPAEGDTIAIFDTSAGEVRAVLYPDLAPMAVDNFVGLAEQGYYNGLVFHRAEYGFVVQSGDGTGTGLGGSTIWNGNPFPAEYTDKLHHYAGALCAANSPDADPSTTSQFYFVQALPSSVDKAAQQTLTDAGVRQEVIDAYAAVGGLPYLDNTDTVFGQVYEGMEVVDAIAGGEKGEDGQILEPVTINSVTISTYGTPDPAPASQAASEPASGSASASAAE